MSFAGWAPNSEKKDDNSLTRDLSSVEPPAPNYKVNCKAENYRPHLYADKYDVVVDYDKILKEFENILEDLGLDPEVDGNKILMSHHYGPGTVCKEKVRQAIRVPAIENQRITSNYDNWGYFGRRWVSPSNSENPFGGCNGMGVAIFHLMGIEPINWELDKSECLSGCDPSPTTATEEQIEDFKRWVDEEQEEPPKGVFNCTGEDCGIAIYKLVSDGGDKCKGTATAELIAIDLIDGPTWEISSSSCDPEKECKGKLPIDVTPEEILQFIQFLADPYDKANNPDGTKKPTRLVNCIDTNGGGEPSWDWDLITPCTEEGCSSIPPSSITRDQIEDATKGETVTVEVKCLKSGFGQGESCMQKIENKPVPAPYSSVDGRTCDEDLLGAYAEKLIGYTKEDADRLRPPALLDNLVKPILPSELGVALDQNRPPFKIVVNKSLYSLQEYRFTIGDSE